MTRLPYSISLALATLLASCSPELNLEPAPDIRAELESFGAPDATVVSDIMETVGDQLIETRDDIQDSSLYEEIIDVVIEVQEELYNEQGQVDLGGGLTFDSPNGGVDVTYICDGWTVPPPAEPDPANGSVNLNMRLAGGSIAPLVWGSVEECRYPLEIGETRLDALYRGDISVYFAERGEPGSDSIEGEPLRSDQDPYELEIYFLADGSVDLDDELNIPIREFFSVTFAERLNGDLYLDELEILVELPDDTTFVYGVNFDASGRIIGQTILDSTGKLVCSLEERFCTTTESETFSW